MKGTGKYQGKDAVPGSSYQSPMHQLISDFGEVMPDITLYLCGVPIDSSLLAIREVLTALAIATQTTDSSQLLKELGQLVGVNGKYR